MRYALTVLIVFSLVARVAADDLFVSNIGGDDRFDGASPQRLSGYTGPTQTIAKALRISRPGDRIVLENTGVPYFESITLEAARHSGRPGQPFILEGNGAILDGAVEIPLTAWQHVRDDVYRVQPALMHYQQLFLGDQPAPRAAELTNMQPRQWLMGVGQLYFRTDADTMPQAYAPRYAGQRTGITLYEVHDVAVLNLEIRGFQIDGVNCHDRARGVLLAGLSCHANGRSGIAICGASQADIANSLLMDNGQAQLHVEGYSETHVQGSRLIGNTAPATERLGGRLYLHD